MANTTPDNVPTTDIAKLQAAITDTDALAQGGFSEIASIAKLALAWLERPESYGNLGAVADALNAIWGKAEQIDNCINWNAEECGCNWENTARARRYAAERQYRESQTQPSNQPKGASHV